MNDESRNHPVCIRSLSRLLSTGVFLFLFSFLSLAQDARELTAVKPKVTDKRIALVIGNGTYQKARQLANSANDAADIANALTGLGFEVISGVNLSLKQMNEKVREFGDRLKANGGVGLFYYAGHGLQVSGRNYLVPVEADIPREDEVAFNAMNLDAVLQKMASANNGLNIVILDACRNNPFARSWSRGESEGGLAQITAPTGTFIAYATSPDRTASDGEGRNGLYTSQLLRIIKQPNLKIEEAFKQVTIGVDKASGGKQIPWTSSSLRGDFYFNLTAVSSKPQPQPNSTAVVPKPTPLPTPTPVTVTPNFDTEGMYWQTISTRDSRASYELYLAEYPIGKYAAEARNKIDKFKQDELTRLKGVERSKWREAQSLDSKNAYNAYIAAYPKGEFVADARSNIKALETNEERAKWLEDQKLNTKDAYRSYLTAYPNGEFAEKARSGINALETNEDQAKWDEIQILNRKTAFQSYLSAYPNGKYATAAKQRIKEFDDNEALRQRENDKAIEKAKWDDAQRAKTAAGYKDYLTAYPKGEFASLARLNLRDLRVVVDAPTATPTALTESLLTPTIHQMLDRYIQAIGGNSAMEKLTTRVMNGSYESIFGKTKSSMTFEEYQKSPNKSLSIIGGSAQYGFNGAIGWEKYEQSGPSKVTGVNLAALKRQSTFDWTTKLSELYAKISFLRKDKVNGREVYVFEAIPPDGKPDTLYFDAETALLLRFDFYYAGVKGVGAKLTQSYYEDYREVDGVKLPFTIRSVNSSYSATVKVYEVKHNIPIDDAKFEVPGKQ